MCSLQKTLAILCSLNRLRGAWKMDGVKVVGNVTKKYFIITLAAAVYSAGIGLFLDPNDLAPGGVSGIAIILSRLVPVETGTFILLLNIPILLVGLWKFGIHFLASSIYAVFLTTVFTNFAETQQAVVTEPLLAAIFGGVLYGFGMAVIFRQNGTTGGVDIVVKLIRIKYPHLKTSTLFLMLDAIVIMGAGLFFGNIESALYAAIAVFVSSKTLDFVLYGSDEARMFYIIGDCSEEIAKSLMEKLEVGVTFLKGRGAYYNKQKEVILCVCQKKVAPKVLECVKDIDKNAFMLVCSANEIYGEGYKSYDSVQY
jgi:uncharacterized membrane-anchored protein YitT (DUF2179 family)